MRGTTTAVLLPQARIVDPFAPEADFTIWVATNPLTRKVAEIRQDPRVTLLYFNAAAAEYVTVLGTATLVSDSASRLGTGRKSGRPSTRRARAATAFCSFGCGQLAWRW